MVEDDDQPRPRRPPRPTPPGDPSRQEPPDPFGDPPDPDEPPSYTLYRARPNLLPRLPRRTPREPGGLRKRRPITPGRIVRWLAVALGAWLLLSLVLFVVSVHLAPGVSAQAKAALDPGGWPLTSANTILVLGSDQRTKGTKEPGASTSGPSRSDVMLLIRAGGGRAARLSIPRDTIVAIPGHGRAKINAAYAFGGPSLAIQTVKQYLGIPINHLVEVNFDNFPALVDALGGVDYTGGCVVSLISGGFRNGGYTLRLKAGTTHLNGKQALALARTRHNDCAPSETDLVRARRQQKLFSAMEHRMLSPGALLRLPWISWNAPPAIRTDMGAASLIGLFGALSTGGSPPTQILQPDGTATLSDGGVGLLVSAGERRAATQRFLAG
jgi:LCP family protein required for cell wall assembly